MNEVDRMEQQQYNQYVRMYTTLIQAEIALYFIPELSSIISEYLLGEKPSDDFVGVYVSKENKYIYFIRIDKHDQQQQFQCQQIINPQISFTSIISQNRKQCKGEIARKELHDDHSQNRPTIFYCQKHAEERLKVIKQQYTRFTIH